MLKILNKGTYSTKNNNSKSILTGKENTLGKNNNSNNKNKKVVYEEESDSEPEKEESEYILKIQEIEEPTIEKRQPTQKRKNNIFEYLNNDAKRNK